MTAPWRAVPGGLAVGVRAMPRGGHAAIKETAALADGRRALKIRVRAASGDRAANEAARRLLAKALGCPASAVALAASPAARLKTFRIEGGGAILAAMLARREEGS